MPRDYNSFAVAFLSQNHREINIAGLILVSIKVIIACIGGVLIMTSWYSLDIMGNMATKFSLTAHGCRKVPLFCSGGQFPSKFDIMIPKTPLQRYCGLDPKIINNTCDTEENGTATCIKGNPHDIIGNPLV